MIKARVNKNLNIRTKKPEVLPYNNSDNAYYKPGDEIEIAEKVEGEEYKGNKFWYKLTNGTFVWSGGVDATYDDLQVANENNIKTKINYNSMVNLPFELKITQGENVVIAVLDTGCYSSHKDLPNELLPGYDVLSGTNKINDVSTKGHGTFVCGLIAGNTTSNGIIGVAPKVKIIPVRVIENTAVISSNVLKGLNWLLYNSTITPDIINMSFDFPPGSDKSEFEKLLSLASSKQILIVAAGQDYNKPAEDGIYYPAKLSNSIAVSTMDSSILNNPDFKGINKKINYIVPKYKYYSAHNLKFKQYYEAEGSSFATAILTGTLALALAYKRKFQLEETAIAILNERLPLYVKDQFINNFKIWKT